MKLISSPLSAAYEDVDDFAADEVAQGKHSHLSHTKFLPKAISGFTVYFLSTEVERLTVVCFCQRCYLIFVIELKSIPSFN
jgi:hypothetical protein